LNFRVNKETAAIWRRNIAACRRGCAASACISSILTRIEELSYYLAVYPAAVQVVKDAAACVFHNDVKQRVAATVARVDVGRCAIFPLSVSR
jgi:hypothetical protein